jgi:hypothetical protein
LVVVALAAQMKEREQTAQILYFQALHLLVAVVGQEEQHLMHKLVVLEVVAPKAEAAVLVLLIRVMRVAQEILAMQGQAVVAGLEVQDLLVGLLQETAQIGLVMVVLAWLPQLLAHLLAERAAAVVVVML